MQVSFIAWVVFTALHVLGHLPGLGRSLRATREGSDPALSSLSGAPGALGTSGRWLALGGALVAGVVLAIVLIPDFHVWTSNVHFGHFHGRH